MAELADDNFTFDAEVAIAKVDGGDGKPCRIFGWASIIEKADGKPVIDRQKDLILPPDLEEGAYEFVMNYGVGGEMHKGDATATKLIESFVATPEKLKAMGLEGDALRAGWWTGWEVVDPGAIAKVRGGTYRALSIQGRGTRTPIEVDA